MKKTRIKGMMVWAPMAAALMLCGCATVSENTHAYLGSPHYPPTDPAHVQLYATNPKQPIIQLGEVVLSVEGNPSRDTLEQKLKQAAAKLGADGVFIASDQTHIYPLVYWDYWGPASGQDWQRVVVGVAFKNK